MGGWRSPSLQILADTLVLFQLLKGQDYAHHITTPPTSEFSVLSYGPVTNLYRTTKFSVHLQNLLGVKIEMLRYRTKKFICSVILRTKLKM